MKRFTLTVLASTLTLLALTGCGSGDSEESDACRRAKANVDFMLAEPAPDSASEAERQIRLLTRYEADLEEHC